MSSALSVMIPTSVQTIPRTLKTTSCRLRRAISRAVLVIGRDRLVRFAESLSQDVPHDVEAQCHQKQRETGCKNRLISGRFAGKISLADLYDKGSDRGRRF